MRREGWIALLVAVAVVAGTARGEGSYSAMSDDAAQAIASAEMVVEQARRAMGEGKACLDRLAPDSERVGEIKSMIVATSKEWDEAVLALDGAKRGATRVSSAATEELANAYSVLAKANAAIARSGANVVKANMAFVEKVAAGATENSLDIAGMSVRDALAASKRARENYERVKRILFEEYKVK